MRITRPPSRGILLYDPDCGFCTRAARVLGALRPEATVHPMTAADLDALGVDEDRARREIPLVHGDGTVVWGARAIGQTLAGCPVPWRWAGRAVTAPLIAPLAERIYALVAANRHRLPGGSRSCRS